MSLHEYRLSGPETECELRAAGTSGMAPVATDTANRRILEVGIDTYQVNCATIS